MTENAGWQASQPRDGRVRHLHFALAGFVMCGVLLQAALAGRHIGNDAPIALHGTIGNAVFLAQAALVAVVVLRHAPRPTIVIALALLVLLVSQIGLGYAARNAPNAVAWHILNGVALFGIASVQLSRSRSNLGADR